MGYKSGYVDPYNSFINYADQNWENMVTTGLEKMKTTAVEVMVNIPGVDTVNDATVFITGYDLGLQKQSRAWAVAGIVAPVSGQTMKKGAKIVDKIPGVNKFRSEIVKKVKAKLGKKGTKPKKVEAKGKDDAHFGENNSKPETGKTKGKVNTVNKSIKGLKNTENFSKNGLEHIFKGEINKSGKAVGFHVEGVEGSVGKVTEITKKPNKFGVYEGKIEVEGIPKITNGGRSTFYPKNMSSQDIVNSINEAYKNRKGDPIIKDLLVGTDKNGMKIGMFLDKSGKITTAYPIY